MPFSESEKAAVRRYLGFPSVYRASNPRLENAMDVVGAQPEVVLQVQSDLSGIAQIEANLLALLPSAGVKKVDEIEFFDGGQQKAMKDEGRRLCGRLSTTMGVPLVGDAFGGSGYEGDGWGGVGFQYGGGVGCGGNGGMFPCG